MTRDEIIASLKALGYGYKKEYQGFMDCVHYVIATEPDGTEHRFAVHADEIIEKP